MYFRKQRRYRFLSASNRTVDSLGSHENSSEQVLLFTKGLQLLTQRPRIIQLKKSVERYDLHLFFALCFCDGQRQDAVHQLISQHESCILAYTHQVIVEFQQALFIARQHTERA